MDRVEEIEAAIEGLPPEEYGASSSGSARASRSAGMKRWTATPSAGKLDFLFEEAERESAQGLLREWPPRK